MLDNRGSRHTLRICNTNCFPRHQMVRRMCPINTLYVQCLTSEARSQNCEKRPLNSSCLYACLSVCLSVLPSVLSHEQLSSKLKDFHEIRCDYFFFENLSRKFKFHYNLTRITATAHVNRYTFMIISRSIVLRMRNISDKICRENQNTHFKFNVFFFSKILPFMR